MPTAEAQNAYASRVQILKALAHPTRLLLVDTLAAGERCVCEMRDLVGDDLSTVSKHLSLLTQAGILARERRGQKIFYRLRVPCVLQIFACVEDVIHSEEATSCNAAS